MSKIATQRASGSTRVAGACDGRRLRSEIIKAIEELQPDVNKPVTLNPEEICEVCRYRSFDPSAVCLRCGWERGRRCAESIRQKYLIALACAAVWGIRSIPCQQSMRFAGKLALQALCHVARHPEQAERIAGPVRPHVVQLGEWGASNRWPWNPWPRPRTGQLCTHFRPELILSALSTLEAEAWSVFRLNRWPEKRGLCPNKQCSQHVLHHGSEYVSRSGKQGGFYTRWLCESFDQRVKARWSRQAKIVQKNPRRERFKAVLGGRREGCGQYFSDITNTPFDRRIPMVHWFLLMVGDIYAVEVLLANGVASKRIIKMVCDLDEFCQREWEVIKRLKANLSGILGKAYVAMSEDVSDKK